MQQNRGRPKTGKNYKRTTISYPKGFEVVLKQVKEWNPAINFSQEFTKAINELYKELARQR